MGKTKTAIVSENKKEEAKTGADKYKEKQARKAQEEAQKIRVPGLGGGQRVAAIEGAELPTEEQVDSAKTTKGPKVRSKNYKTAKGKVDTNKTYSLKEAVKLVKETSYSKFDGSVELHLVVKKEGMSVNVNLPHSGGKQKKVEVADDKTIEKLNKGTIDFDVLLATADMMPKLVPFARLLGPKGMMPNPKNGTLIKSAKDADKFSGNTLTVKTERKQPVVHTVIGKVSQDEIELMENLEAVISAISTKQIEKAYLKPTMGPSVKLAL